jgi:DNA processing protein
MKDERSLAIALNTLPALRAAAYHAAVARFGSVAGVLAAPPEAFGGLRGFGPETVAAVRGLDAARAAEAEEERARAAGIALVTLHDAEYPEALRLIPDPPPVLSVRGTLSPADAAAVAVVGCRAATAYGRTVAERLAAELAGFGVTVVSGLARGIDGCAHRAAVAAGGRSIAVLGSGLDRIYPPEHRRLAAELAENGAVISEFPLGAAPDPWHFPLRNRVISGLSLGVVVVEAAAKSGALITADAALEQGREVFAVPGPVTAPTSAGPNRLIRQGARLVEGARDVLEELPALAGRLGRGLPAQPPLPEVTEVESRILALFPGAPLPIDAIIRSSPAPAAETAALLTALELKGLVRQHPGKLFARA